MGEEEGRGREGRWGERRKIGGEEEDRGRGGR